MILATVLLVALNGPDHQVIWVNPAEIVSIRALREAHKDHIANQTECVLQTVDGKVIYVVDECDVVRAKLARPPDPE